MNKLSQLVPGGKPENASISVTLAIYDQVSRKTKNGKQINNYLLTQR